MLDVPDRGRHLDLDLDMVTGFDTPLFKIGVLHLDIYMDMITCL